MSEEFKDTRFSSLSTFYSLLSTHHSLSRVRFVRGLSFFC